MLLSGSSFSWPYLPSMWHTGALWRQLATTTWSTPSQPFYNGSTLSSIPTSSSSAANDTGSCFNSTSTSASSVIDPLLGTTGLFNSSSSSSPSATFATANPSFYANCYAALSASTFSSTMGSSSLNGMNFFNLNPTTTPPSLFGSSAGTASAYKESCKYVSPHDDEEMENDEDGERLLGGAGNHLNKSNNNNITSSYNERSNERSSHVTGEENTN